MTAGRCSRTLRAAMFATVCVLLATTAHVMMSGAHVPGWTLAAARGATGAVACCLAGRERGLPLVVCVVAAARAVLNRAFSLAQSDGAGATGGPASGGTPARGMDMGSTPSR